MPSSYRLAESKHPHIKDIVDETKANEIFVRTFELAKKGDLDGLNRIVAEVWDSKILTINDYRPQGLLRLLRGIKDEKNQRPWDYIVRYQHQHILSDLYQQSPKINVASMQFWYGFHFNQLNAVKEALSNYPRLIEYGIRCLDDEMNILKLTHVAVANNSLELVKFLSQYPIEQYLDQLFAKGEISEKELPKAKEWVKKQTHFTEEDLQKAIEQDYRDIIYYLMTELKITHVNGYPAVLIALVNDNEDLASSLLDQKHYEEKSIERLLFFAFDQKLTILDRLLSLANQNAIFNLIERRAAKDDLETLKKIFAYLSSDNNNHTHSGALRNAATSKKMANVTWLMEHGAKWSEDDLIEAYEILADKDDPQENLELRECLKRQAIDGNFSKALEFIDKRENKIAVYNLLIEIKEEKSQEKIDRLVQITANHKEYVNKMFLQLAAEGELAFMQAIRPAVNINATKWGYSALRIAAKNGSMEMIQWLVSEGATWTDNALLKAYKKALKNDRIEMKTFLKEQAKSAGFTEVLKEICAIEAAEKFIAEGIAASKRQPMLSISNAPHARLFPTPSTMPIVEEEQKKKTHIFSPQGYGGVE